jgi:hypothetical protein
MVKYASGKASIKPTIPLYTFVLPWMMNGAQAR